jgi:uncharacterized protein
MRNPLLLAAVIFTLSVPAAAQFVRLPDAVPDRPVVVVSGQAEVMVAPDQVLFRLESENVDPDLKKAKARTDEEGKKILELTHDYKIEPQNVQTSYIRISKHFTPITPSQPSRFDGYSVKQTTTILLTDVSRFESLLSDIVKAGVSDVSDVTFRASQMRKYMDQARALAMRAAREKAVALAGEVRQGIGKAISITESGLTVSSAYEGEDSSGSNYVRNASSVDFDPKAASDNQGSIAPGMISIVARVKVTFELN